MTKQTIKLATLAAALALAGAAHAQDARLLPAAQGDMALRTLATDAPVTPPSVERAPVHFAWALPADAGPIMAPTPYTAVSREYWKDVDGAALARGMTIHTTAPGALVLISPAGDDSRAVAPGALQVRQGSRVIAARDATVALAPQAALEAATGASFAPGALGFRLAPALGAGAFDLQVADARGRYVVHVREPDSAAALRVENPAPAYRTGDRVSLQASLDNGAGHARLGEIGGMLVAPDGRDFPLRAVRTRGGIRLDAVLPQDASSVPGLWEAHVLAAGDADGAEVLRDAKVAFEVTAPTARLRGRYSARSDAGGQLVFDLPVEVGSPGRYEVRALLYGTDARGELAPVAVGHAADWLGRGAGALTLVFPPEVIGNASAPYELRQLGLNDQGRMGRLEYRERAARMGRPLAGH
jgi:hypothetical protein